MGARERTFDVDLINNATGAAGADGVVDATGTHFINLQSLLTSRDNLRQAETDLSVPDVAASSGFNSPEHFARSFRAQFGRPPLKYRSLVRGR